VRRRGSDSDPAMSKKGAPPIAAAPQTRHLPSTPDSKLESLKKLFEAEIEEIDHTLLDYLEGFEHPRSHYRMMAYHFGYADRNLERLRPGEFLPRGKRLRPILCMLFCRMMKVDAELGRIVMMATEVMHAASLAHDDIEDKDPVRWGRPTVNFQFGTDLAINMGDGLIGLVYELLLELTMLGVAPQQALDVLKVFNGTHLRMCEGQYLDLTSKFHDELQVEDYLDMIVRKTASPCTCIADTIAILSSCREEDRRTLHRFGESLGVLYQICDDIRGLWSDPKVLGRQVGGDIGQQRASLPLLYGFRQGTPAFREALKGRQAGQDAIASTDMEWIRAELDACGAYELCLRDATTYYDDALEALGRLDRKGAESAVLTGILDACFASVQLKG